MSRLIPGLSDELDLRYRPREGESTCYSMDIRYRTISETGRVVGAENYRGALRRDIEAVHSTGVSEHITWRHVGHRQGADEQAYGPWQEIEWANGFSYLFDAEEGYEEYHWDYSSFPRDEASWLTSWNVLLLTVDAHFEFDFLRSRRHGAIDQLRRVGDSVLAPDSGHPFRLVLDPWVDVPAFTKRNLRTTVLGLSVRGDVPCAVLSFGMDVSPFEMTIANATLEVSSIFRGTLTVRLADGVLEHGEFDEVVSRVGGSVYPHYELRRIAPEDWEAGTLSARFD